MSTQIPNEVFEEVVPIKDAVTEPLGVLARTTGRRHLHPKADVHVEAEDVDSRAPGYRHSVQQFASKFSKREKKSIAGFRANTAAFHKQSGGFIGSAKRGLRTFRERHPDWSV